MLINVYSKIEYAMCPSQKGQDLTIVWPPMCGDMFAEIGGKKMVKYEFSKDALRNLLYGHIVAMFGNYCKQSTLKRKVSNVLYENRYKLGSLHYMDIVTSEKTVNIFLWYKNYTRYVISIGANYHDDGRIDPYVKFIDYQKFS